MCFIRTMIGRATLLLCAFGLAQAQTVSPEVTRADTWLRAQVQADGAINGVNNAIANPTQVGGEVARALGMTGMIPQPLLQRLTTNPELNTEYLARLAMAQSLTQSPSAALLTSLQQRQNPDGGFAAANGFASNITDTTFALSALSSLGDVASAQSARACAFWRPSKTATEVSGRRMI